MGRRYHADTLVHSESHGDSHTDTPGRDRVYAHTDITHSDYVNEFHSDRPPNHTDGSVHIDEPTIPSHTDHSDIPAVAIHGDTPAVSHGDTHVDAPKMNHIDIHTDTALIPAVRHQDIHADIEVSETVTHIDTPPIPAVFIHEDTPFIAPDNHGDTHGDVTGVLHGDASNFHLDISNPHTDIPHSDSHGDGLQFSDNGAHADVHHDAPPDHTDGINHADFITTLLNNREDFHEDIPRIAFHSDSLFRADRSLENESGEEDK
jgi:hypothetical protein